MNKYIYLIMFFLFFNILSQEEKNKVIIKESKEKKDASQIITRSFGDQSLTLGLGVTVPIAFNKLNSSFYIKPNLSPGIAATIQWGAFLTNGLSLGVDPVFHIDFGVNTNVYFDLQVGGKIAYYFRSYPFEFPIYISTGLLYSQYKSLYNFSYYLRAGFGFYWNAFKDWSIGLDVNYLFTPQIYTGKSPIPKSHSRLAHFIDVAILMQYNF